MGDAESKPPAAAGFLSGLKLWGHGVGGVSLGWGGRERAVAAAETQMPSEQEIVANAVTGDRAGHSTCVPMPGPTPSTRRSRVTQSLHARPAWGGLGRPSPCDPCRAAHSVALRRPGCPAGRHANAHRGVPSAGSRSPWSARAPAHALVRAWASPEVSAGGQDVLGCGADQQQGPAGHHPEEELWPAQGHQVAVTAPAREPPPPLHGETAPSPPEDSGGAGREAAAVTVTVGTGPSF